MTQTKHTLVEKVGPIVMTDPWSWGHQHGQMTRVKGGVRARFGEVLSDLGIKFDNTQFFPSDVFIAVVKCWLLFGTTSTRLENERKIIDKKCSLLWLSSLRVRSMTNDHCSIHQRINQNTCNPDTDGLRPWFAPRCFPLRLFSSQITPGLDSLQSLHI